MAMRRGVPIPLAAVAIVRSMVVLVERRGAMIATRHHKDIFAHRAI
jgi:hypothetical protein